VPLVPTLLAALALAAPPVTVLQVQAAFRASTGTPLVRVASASTSFVTTLESRPPTTPRFGFFELYVLRPKTAAATRRAILGGARPDSRGIYWTPDQQAGFVATTVYRPNLVAAWFPPGGRKRVDARWARLDALLGRLF
jgi:hypothetical protein